MCLSVRKSGSYCESLVVSAWHAVRAVFWHYTGVRVRHIVSLWVILETATLYVRHYTGVYVRHIVSL